MPIEECPICFEHIIEKDEIGIINKNITKTECGHLFCKSCLERWQLNEPGTPPCKCPTCRQPIKRVDDTFTVLRVNEEILPIIRENDIQYDRMISDDLYIQNRGTKLLCIFATVGSTFLIYISFYSFNF